jgi:protein O-mannosyl-transferase
MNRREDQPNPLRWAPLLIIVLGALAYANSFRGQFMLDDDRSIADNVEALRSPLGPRGIFHATPFVTRPVVGLSLALSYRISGLATWGYHLVNIAIHLLAGLCLWALVRRACRHTLPGAQRSADGLAFLIALLWTVHPLQTQSVTYIIQRSEALAGLFCLLTILCVARAAQGGWWWSVAAVLACALGMGTKQVMLSAPFLVLFYDRTFLAGSFAGALRRRWGVYLGLASTWSIVFITYHLAPTTLGAGFGASPIGVWPYLRTQPRVILHYLRLCLWPYPQCLDDMWPVANKVGEILPGTVLVVLALAGTLWALARRPVLGFLGACFFLCLGPTSSIVPIEDLAFEHRMYLALAPVTALLVLAVRALLVRITRGRVLVTALVVVAVLACMGRTLARNRDYDDQIRMWSNVVAQRPWNFRAHNNLGLGFRAVGRHEEAERHFRQAVQQSPSCWYALYNMGLAMEVRGDWAQASAYFERSRKSNKDYPPTPGKLTNALNNDGLDLRSKQRLNEAEAQFRKALAYDPHYWQAHYNLGLVQSQQGFYPLAIAQFRETLRLHPGFGEAKNQAAWAAYHHGLNLAASGNSQAAQVAFAESLGFSPAFAEAIKRGVGAGKPAAGVSDPKGPRQPQE